VFDLTLVVVRMDGDEMDPDSGRLHITRLSTRKNWIKVFEDKVAEEAKVKADNYVAPERQNLADSIAAGSIIAKKIGKRVRRRLRDKQYSCRRTIDNLKEPTDPLNWDPLAGTQLVCDICGMSALFDVTGCR